LRGEKDFHDAVIESYERQAKERRDQQQAQLDEVCKSTRAKHGDQRIISKRDPKALTPRGAEEAVRQRQLELSERLSVADESAPDYSEKWLGK
jgi:hypothetical protein